MALQKDLDKFKKRILNKASEIVKETDDTLSDILCKGKILLEKSKLSELDRIRDDIKKRINHAQDYYLIKSQNHINDVRLEIIKIIEKNSKEVLENEHIVYNFIDEVFKNLKFE